MIAVDTNVLVRFLVRDDEQQAAAARRCFKRAEAGRERLFIPLLVVLELLWVLESAYDRSRSEILDALQAMVRMAVFEFEGRDVIERLLGDGPSYMTDLSDILIAHSAQAAGCEGGLTFDKDAAKLPFFRLLD